MSAPTPGGLGCVPSGPRTELASLREPGGLGGPCYQAKHGAERREMGGASHQATAACHPPGLIQCPVSSAWSLPCLQRSVLHGVRYARVTQYGYRVHRGGGAGPRLGSLGQPPAPSLWESRCEALMVGKAVESSDWLPVVQAWRVQTILPPREP